MQERWPERNESDSDSAFNVVCSALPVRICGRQQHWRPWRVT